MSIEVDKKYIGKDGKVIEVVSLRRNNYGERNNEYAYVAWFKDNEEIIHVLTETDFLEQYKPYEVVYEYQYAYMDFCNCAETTSMFYKDDVEFLETFKDNFNKYFQRLDFTKQRRQ